MKKRPLCMLCVMFLFIQIFRQAPVEAPASSIFSEMTGNIDAILNGQIYKKEQKEKYQILYLKNNSITYQDQTYKESRIMVYDDSFHHVKIGQVIKIKGTLKLFEEARNPGNFDAKLYYGKQKFYGTMWGKEILSVKGTEWSFHEHLYLLRQSWNHLIMEYMGEEQGTILCAILLGEKGGVEEEIKELYQKNGYGHILAISGLHISFIGTGCYHILRKFGLGYYLSGTAAIVILSLYVLLLGFSVSVFRAFVMLLLRIVADITGRVYDMCTALAVSAAMLVSYDSNYLTDASFQLSYGAILAILFVTPAIKKLVGKQGKLWNSFYVSVSVQVALIPITLWWFYEISLYGILWNLLIIPLMSVVMTAGMIGSLLPLKHIWFFICRLILDVFECVGEFGNLLPANRIVIGRPSAMAVALFYVWLLFFLLLMKYVPQYKKLACIGFIVVSLFFVKMPNGDVEITMLDVGQGDCIYIRGPYGKDYLIDGGSSDINQVGKYRIESFLKYKGVGSLEYVFVSHGDLDHYSGIQEMIQRENYSVKIRNLIFANNYTKDEALLQLGKEAVNRGITVCVLEQNQLMEEGPMQMKCIGTNTDEYVGNEGSMVLELALHDFSIIFTGDIELEAEERLIDDIKREYTILKVAHHGSQNGTTEAFLDKTKPKIALISAGKSNKYGHPHTTVLERLEERNITTFCTSQCGSITIKSNGNSLTF